MLKITAPESFKIEPLRPQPNSQRSHAKLPKITPEYHPTRTSQPNSQRSHHSKPPCNKYYLLTATPLEVTPLETTLRQVLLAHSHPTRSHLTRIAAGLRVPPFFQLSSKPINSDHSTRSHPTRTHLATSTLYIKTTPLEATSLE